MHELRHVVVAGFGATVGPGAKFAQKLVDAELVGKVETEVGIVRIEVADELGLGGDVFGNQAEWTMDKDWARLCCRARNGG